MCFDDITPITSPYELQFNKLNTGSNSHLLVRMILPLFVQQKQRIEDKVRTIYHTGDDTAGS